jgi:hypothetical protein
LLVHEEMETHNFLVQFKKKYIYYPFR